MRSLVLCLLVTLATLAAPGRAQTPPADVDPLHRPFDQILDLHVRDGLVYYRMLQAARGSLDRYVASLDVPAATYEGWVRDAKLAFWINAYNAFVLQTVVTRYPIRGRSAEFPASSVAQIPGVFSGLRHRAAGRTVTLDDIEKTILAEFKEPRVFLALGRGAIGSGRLRSEAYTAARLAAQLDAVQAEFVRDADMLRIDRIAGTVSVTPIVSWRSEGFTAAYDPGATGPMAQRSPIERAIVAFITPHLLPLEREFVQDNRFRVTFHEYDWRLNDLTGQ